MNLDLSPLLEDIFKEISIEADSLEKLLEKEAPLIFWVTQGKQTWKRKKFNKKKLGNLAFYLFKHKEDAELHAITLSKDWMKWDKKPAKPISWDEAVRIAEYLNCDVIQILEFTAGNWEHKLVYI